MAAPSSPPLLIGSVDLGALLLVAGDVAGRPVGGMVMPSRDLIVREVTPPGSFGKVFAFVTTGYHVAGILAPLPSARCSTTARRARCSI